ncbi:MAG TPA: recombinase family protein [Chthonomonadaceae bacterium]|nr:recombinase family protein [Chthonomonadaceae bacterium]
MIQAEFVPWAELGSAERQAEIERLQADMAANVSKREGIREERRPKGRLRYPPLDPQELWAEFERKTAGGRKVQIRWWRESDEALLEGEAVEEHIRAVTVFCQTHRPAQENENYFWAYEVCSGLASTRPIGDVIVDMISTSKVASLIVPRKDRWNRNVEFNARSRRAIVETETDLCSVMENVDITTPAGRLFDTILTAIAQFDAEMSKMRMYAGRVGAIRNRGMYFGGEPPVGYRPITYRPRGQRGQLEICETEAPLVGMIFWLRSLGYRPHPIADWLNRQGFKTRKGKRWTWQQVQRILEREAQYRAEALWNHVDGAPEAILHQPILPHRSDPATRIYVEGGYVIGTSERHQQTRRPIWKKIETNSPVPYRGVDLIIPDDPTQEPQRIRLRGRRKAENLTRDQARMLLMLYRLVDAGRNDYQIAKTMNEAALSTLLGKMWTPRAVTYYRGDKARGHYERIIKEMGVTGMILPTNADRIVSLEEEKARYLEGKQREEEAVAMIKRLREENPKMPLRQIATAVNEAGLLTANGCQWYPAGVSRVFQGKQRAVEMVRRARRLLAEHVHEDGTVDGPFKMAM